jgi:hypothetical protein
MPCPAFHIVPPQRGEPFPPPPQKKTASLAHAGRAAGFHPAGRRFDSGTTHWHAHARLINQSTIWIGSSSGQSTRLLTGGLWDHGPPDPLSPGHHALNRMQPSKYSGHRCSTNWPRSSIGEHPALTRGAVGSTPIGATSQAH